MYIEIYDAGGGAIRKCRSAFDVVRLAAHVSKEGYIFYCI